MAIIQIDDDKIEYEVDESSLLYGIDEVLALKESDICQSQVWYESGFCILNLLTSYEFTSLLNAVRKKLINIFDTLCIDVPDNFNLDSYHTYVKNDETHQKIIELTREFTFDDLEFNLEKIVSRISNKLKIRLDSFNPILLKSFVIVRINRPLSNDFNPAHKDAYLDLWKKTINVWIPIAGVSKSSSLPIVPGSHLLSENCIKRSMSGARVNGKNYRVPVLTEWNSSNLMTRPPVSYGEALIFSPYLIHGFAKNFEQSTTRIALELRLNGNIDN